MQTSVITVCLHLLLCNRLSHKCNYSLFTKQTITYRMHQATVLNDIIFPCVLPRYYYLNYRIMIPITVPSISALNF